MCGSRNFIETVERLLHIADLSISFRNECLISGKFDTVFVDFSNVPKAKAHGACFENNRLMFVISGFGAESPAEPPPTGKVKIMLRVSGLPRQYRLRAKTGTPAQIAQYLTDFLHKVVREVEPKINPWD